MPMLQNSPTRRLSGFTLFVPVLLFLLMLAVESRSATRIDDIRPTQVVQKGSDISVYFAALDNRQEPLLSVDPSELSLTIDGRPVEISGIVPLSDGDNGVAYIFLIDISKSLDGQFDQLKGALTQWIGDFGETDQAAVVTVGSDVKRLVDFSNDRETLNTAIAGLQPRDPDTLLFRGIIEASHMGGIFGSASGLPARRAIVMLSDGDNDPPGQNDTLTPPRYEEVKEVVTNAGIPIYALWLPSDEKRDRAQVGREHLAEFARLSHGEFHEAEEYDGDLETAYADLRARIKEGFVAQVVCDECPQGLLPRNVEFRLAQAKTEGEEPQTDETETASGATETTDPEVDVDPLPEPPIFEQNWFWALIALGVIVLGAAGAYVFRGPLFGKTQSQEKTGDAAEVPPAQGRTVAAEDAPGPAPLPILLHLTVESKNDRGKRYELDLKGAATLGRESGCDLSFPNDPQMSREHCKIELTGGRLLISDLKSENGTYLNGVRIFGRRPLENGDLLCLGHTEMRVLVAE